jgi:hypothetical protein
MQYATPMPERACSTVPIVSCNGAMATQEARHGCNARVGNSRPLDRARCVNRRVKFTPTVFTRGRFMGTDACVKSTTLDLGKATSQHEAKCNDVNDGSGEHQLCTPEPAIPTPLPLLGRRFHRRLRCAPRLPARCGGQPSYKAPCRQLVAHATAAGAWTKRSAPGLCAVGRAAPQGPPCRSPRALWLPCPRFVRHRSP